MRPFVSVIIPVLNEERRIGILLEAFEDSSKYEVIVVDGGSKDNTLAELKRFPFVRILSSLPGRGVQLNTGADAAKGDILWFLHADCTLPLGWIEEISSVLEQPGVIAGSFCLRFDEPHWLLRVFSVCSRLNHSLFTYGDQGFFMKRRVFHGVGKFRNYPILEDMDIQRRLRARGAWGKSPLPLVTSSRRFLQNGILRQQLKNLGIIALFQSGASPFWLAGFYPPESGSPPSPSSQSASRKPTALNPSVKRKGRFTRFPFWVKS